MTLAETFGRNVRSVRLAKALTIEALATDVEVSYSYLGQIERGSRNPSLALVERIAASLDVDPVALLSQP